MRTLSITDRIQSRILLLYRADPAVVAPLLPERLAPATYRDRCMLGVCFTRMSDPPHGWLPISFGRDHLTWRFPVVVAGTTNEPERRAVWVPRRHTSSWFGARCAGRLVRGHWMHSEFELDESPGGSTLQVHTGGQLELLVRAERCGELGSLVFAHVEELRQSLCDGTLGSLSHPPFSFAPGFDRLDLEPERWRLEALRVHEARAPRFENGEKFPAGSVVFDCAVRMTNLREQPVSPLLRARFAPLDPAAAQALPSA